MPATAMEMWGGVECTVNRVGDVWYDQLELSGHDVREEDVGLFASLGLRAVRYPVLWERTAPDDPEGPDWSWSDRRLGLLREHDVRPIVGLVHHGSGPRYTDLLDPGFPEKLARYAFQVAERYPWIETYTPVNEPLTTARFSGLYGLWYPHERSDRAFCRALLAQCRGTILAMRAIRTVNSDAALLQTEDLGRTYSVPALAYQAGFENERRWLTHDLLCGHVGSGHPLREYFRWAGISESELEWFLENPLPPDVIGINHYVTSERFLDTRLDRYPHETHGGNGRHRYADVEAVRAIAEGIGGFRMAIDETWRRYGRPVAITEVHLGGPVEERMRWLNEALDAATHCRDEGCDVRAITAWGLLGSFDWDCLLTRRSGCYEPGVFDVRSPLPAPTPLVEVVRRAARGEGLDHPALHEPGWWRRPERLLYPPVDRSGLDVESNSCDDSIESDAILCAAELHGEIIAQREVIA